MAITNLFQSTLLQPDSMSPPFAFWEGGGIRRFIEKGGPLVAGNDAMTPHSSVADPVNTGEIQHVAQPTGTADHTVNFYLRLVTFDPFEGVFVLSPASGVIINGQTFPFTFYEEDTVSYAIRDMEQPGDDYPLPEIGADVKMTGTWAYRPWAPPELSLTLYLPFLHPPIDFMFYADIDPGDVPPVFWTKLVNSYEK